MNTADRNRALVAMARPAAVELISKPGADEIVYVVTGVATGSDPYVCTVRHITIRRDRNERRFTLFVAGERHSSSKVMRRLRRTASELECVYMVELADMKAAADLLASPPAACGCIGDLSTPDAIPCLTHVVAYSDRLLNTPEARRADSAACAERELDMAGPAKCAVCGLAELGTGLTFKRTLAGHVCTYCEAAYHDAVTVTRCSRCNRPAHASETNDADVCVDCLRRAAWGAEHLTGWER